MFIRFAICSITTSLYCMQNQQTTAMDPNRYGSLPPLYEQLCLEEYWSSDCDTLVRLLPQGFEQEQSQHPNGAIAKLTATKRITISQRIVQDLGEDHQLFPKTIESAEKFCENTINGTPAPHDTLLDYDIEYKRQQEFFEQDRLQKKTMKKEAQLKAIKPLPTVLNAYCAQALTDNESDCDKIISALQSHEPQKFVEGLKDIAADAPLSPATASTLVDHFDDLAAGKKVALTSHKQREINETRKLFKFFPENLSNRCLKASYENPSTDRDYIVKSQYRRRDCVNLARITHCLMHNTEKNLLCADVTDVDNVNKAVLAVLNINPSYYNRDVLAANGAKELLKNVAAHTIRQKKA